MPLECRGMLRLAQVDRAHHNMIFGRSDLGEQPHIHDEQSVLGAAEKNLDRRHMVAPGNGRLDFKRAPDRVEVVVRVSANDVDHQRSECTQAVLRDRVGVAYFGQHPCELQGPHLIREFFLHPHLVLVAPQHLHRPMKVVITAKQTTQNAGFP